jgi:hypothetical protein
MVTTRQIWEYLERRGLRPAAVSVWYDGEWFGCTIRLGTDPLWFWEV